MRRELFDFLNTDLQFVKSVGPVLASRFEEVLGGRRILDFLLHKPAYVRPRAAIDSVKSAQIGEVITIPLLIKSQKTGGVFRNGRRVPTQINCVDKMGTAVVVQFFNVNFLDYWLKKLPVAEWRVISGKLEQTKNGQYIMSHPDFIETAESAEKIPTIQAIYPSTEGLTQKNFTNVRDGVFGAFDFENAGEFWNALHRVHFPQSADDLLPNSDAMMKLAYSELLAHQVAIVLSRQRRVQSSEFRVQREKKHNLLERFYENLPFALTGAQEYAIKEIFDDMQKQLSMMRLVQGDVGSGKTIVALAASLFMAERGGQTAFMAPTDTLAQQHYVKIKPICDEIGIVCDILTGRDKGASRHEKLVSLKSGRTRIIIGTHALFSNDVEYKDLGLVIIDEQHRFGVAQREAIRAKGRRYYSRDRDTWCEIKSSDSRKFVEDVCDTSKQTDDEVGDFNRTAAPRRQIRQITANFPLTASECALRENSGSQSNLSAAMYAESDIITSNPDLLALSATPIPRTLSMTIYGDMDVSIINEKPAGRLPVKTTKLSSTRAEELIARLRPQIDAGAKVFWVCPLVAESETSDLMAAEERYKYLTSSLIHTPRHAAGVTGHPSSIGLVHGKMDKKKRDAAMAEFAAPDSKMRVLVSTTVIEVGIDVPTATIMVIENAERFGLAALHQLRGRVGRGNAQSFCILMFGNNVGENGLKRLDILCESDDGFLIAEQDLMMRGTGELLGTKQSGWVNYNFVDYREHRDLFKLASLRAIEMTSPDEWTHDLMFIFGRELRVKS